MTSLLRDRRMDHGKHRRHGIAAGRRSETSDVADVKLVCCDSSVCSVYSVVVCFAAANVSLQRAARVQSDGLGLRFLLRGGSVQDPAVDRNYPADVRGRREACRD